MQSNVGALIDSQIIFRSNFKICQLIGAGKHGPPMTIKKNIVANYLGQGAQVVFSLAFVPVYIRYLGMEAYGLVGLFTLVQGWLILLDLGMTPTLSREMARYTAGAVAIQPIRDLLRSLEIICLGVAAIVALVIFLAAPWLAGHWLKVDRLPVASVASVLAVMAVVVALRFCEGIYRSALVGLQQQVWYNAANVALAALRSIGAVAILAFVSPTIEAFFLWQGAISLLTLVAFGAKLHLALPPAPRPARFSLPQIIELRRFAGGLIGINIVAVLGSQLDKLLLSKLLPLEQFGYYMLASTISGMILMIVAPVIVAVYPAFVRLLLADDEKLLASTYHATAQLVGAVVSPVAVVLIAYPQAVLFAWSNNAALTTQAAPILGLLALGNFINAVVQVPLQLQLAHGWTRNLIVSNVVALVFLTPLLVWAVPRFGTFSAALIWVAANALHVVMQVPWMHRRLLIGQLRRWYGRDVALPVLGPCAVVVLARFVQPDFMTDRLAAGLFLVAVGGCAGLAAVMLTRTLRVPAVTAVRYEFNRRTSRFRSRPLR